jgi:hypothetical protein
VALHAAFVLSGKSWQDVSIFVTGGAFHLGRTGQIDRGFSTGGRQGVMWIMTCYAVLKSLDGFAREAAMGASLDLLQCLKVAFFTVLHPEEILEGLVDVPGIRVGSLLCNVPMAFLAGCLAMNGNMEPFRINQPPGSGILRAAQKCNRGKNEQDAFADS